MAVIQTDLPSQLTHISLLLDTDAEEAEAGVRLAAQVLTMVVTGSAAGVQCVVQVLQITDLP